MAELQERDAARFATASTHVLRFGRRPLLPGAAYPSLSSFVGACPAGWVC
jgi:hypothetical protein